MFFERAREDAEKEVAADEKNSLVRWVTFDVCGLRCVTCVTCDVCGVRCAREVVHGRGRPSL